MCIIICILCGFRDVLSTVVVAARSAVGLSATLLRNNIFAGETTLYTAGACWLVFRAFQLRGCTDETAVTQFRPVRCSKLLMNRAKRRK